MYNEIVKQNRIRVFICMTVLMIVLGSLGSYISSLLDIGITGTGVFIMIGLIINLVSYYFSDKLILRMSGARKLEPEQIPELFKMIEEMVNDCQMPMPKVYLIDDLSMNAFATGRNPSHSAVAVTKGLLEKLTLDEVKGVVAHELSHIKNLDTLLMTAISIIAGCISIFSDVIWHGRLMDKAQEKDRSGILSIIGVILIVFAPLVAMFIQLAISRQREYLADASGARISKNPMFLATALEKIARDRRPLPRMSNATAHLCFTSPLKSVGIVEKMFSTHPPINERVERLKNLSSKDVLC